MHRAKASSGRAWANSVVVVKSSKGGFRSSLHMNAFKSEELLDKSGWETFSLDEAFAFLERRPQLASVEKLSCILHQCRKKKTFSYTKRLHAYMCKIGLEDHTSLGNYLVPMLVQVGSVHDAQQVFNKLADRNVYSWTSLIMGYVACGESQHALNLYQKMQDDSVHPNNHTFVALLKACARLKDAGKGREIHIEIARKGLERDLFVGNSLVDMYAKRGSLAYAWEVFDRLPVRNEVAWTALIAGYADHSLGKEALKCLELMQLEQVSANAVTFVCCLKACGRIGVIDKGREIHSEIARKGLERYLFVGNTLVDMYAKCGLLAKAREVFDKLLIRDEVSWTALIAGYVEYGFGEEAIHCFEEMQLEGVSPNVVTFICSLKACGSIGAINKGQEIHFEVASKGLERDLFVCSTLVDMYAKCGWLSKSWEIFDKLPIRDVVLWNILHAGYTEHGLGEKALDCFNQMQLEDVSPNALTLPHRSSG